MSWEDILKKRQFFVLLDKVWAEAGGATPEHIPESAGGKRFMTIDEVEEALGRKLNINDFSHVVGNWLTDDLQVRDRLGGDRGRETLAEDFIMDMMSEAKGRSPMYYGYEGIDDPEVLEILELVIKEFPNSDVAEIAEMFIKQIKR